MYPHKASIGGTPHNIYVTSYYEKRVTGDFEQTLANDRKRWDSVTKTARGAMSTNDEQRAG